MWDVIVFGGWVGFTGTAIEMELFFIGGDPGGVVRH
jgi:hypothetical protein